MKYDNSKPKLIDRDIYKFIAEQSTLTQAQVEECFIAYGKLISALAKSEDRMEGLLVAIPKLGTIKFVKVNGRKKGTKYKIPTYYGSKEMKTVELEEDEPDFERIKMTFYDRYKRYTKQTSKNKNLRKRSLDFSFKNE